MLDVSDGVTLSSIDRPHGCMTQHEINLLEWASPENWSEGLVRTYFSKKDSRVFVPNRPWIGDTHPKSYPPISFSGTKINFGHRRAGTWFLVLWLLPIAGLFTVLMLTVKGH
jgi:hypothetical protein